MKTQCKLQMQVAFEMEVAEISQFVPSVYLSSFIYYIWCIILTLCIFHVACVQCVKGSLPWAWQENISMLLQASGSRHNSHSFLPLAILCYGWQHLASTEPHDPFSLSEYADNLKRSQGSVHHLHTAFQAINNYIANSYIGMDFFVFVYIGLVGRNQSS